MAAKYALSKRRLCDMRSIGKRRRLASRCKIYAVFAIGISASNSWIATMRQELTNIIAVCSVVKLISSARDDNRERALFAHKSASIGKESCLDMSIRGAIASMLKIHALADSCIVECGIPSTCSYAVSRVVWNRTPSNTGKASRNEDLKNIVMISRVASLSGSSYRAGERGRSRVEASRICTIGILKSAHETGWSVLWETHLRPASEEIGLPLKYQLGPH